MNFCVDSFFVLIFQLYSIIVSGKYAEVLCRRKKFFKPASFSDVDKSQKESLSFLGEVRIDDHRRTRDRPC